MPIEIPSSHSPQFGLRRFTPPIVAAAAPQQDQASPANLQKFLEAPAESRGTSRTVAYESRPSLNDLMEVRRAPGPRSALNEYARVQTEPSQPRTQGSVSVTV